MTDAGRRPPLSDADLERQLTELGQSIDYPPTPSLGSAVRGRLEASATRPAAPGLRRRWRLANWQAPPVAPLWASLPPSGRVVVAAAAALVLALGVTLTAFPGARAAIAERLGLRGVSIIHVPFLPLPPTATPESAAPGAASRLGLGSRVSLDEARRRVQFRVQLPAQAELATPDEIYFDGGPPGGQIAFVYHPRPRLPAASETGVGLLLTQFRGDLQLDQGLVNKVVTAEVRLERVTVAGRPGIWLEGAPHVFFYRDPTGNARSETVRLAGNTLLWERDGLTLRLEGAIDKATALGIAASVR
ncbi:MAG TPA: hypothetical protein VHS99_26880 [Chloroflexota bacterium]|nr:hypothetical protein [Chloroflexota bacterium]